MSRVRSALTKLGLVGVSLLVALACGEAAVRIYEKLSPPPPAEDPELAGLPELHSVFELARPNVRGRFVGVLWRTNSGGFRGAEVTPEPAPGTFRIALIGDSWAAGQGVREEDTYAVQLERMLDATHAAPDFEVLNFGIGGLNAKNVVDRARRLGPRYHPQLYVYGYTLNDIFEGEDTTQLQQGTMDASLQRLAEMRDSRSHLWLLIWTRLVSLHSVFGGSDSYVQLVLDSYNDPEKLARVELALGQLARLAQRSNACVEVLIHTDLSALRIGHRFVDTYGVVEKLARDAGLNATITWPRFRWRDSAALRISLFDGHPNAAGHRLFAEALYDSLRELPPYCGVPKLPPRGDD